MKNSLVLWLLLAVVSLTACDYEDLLLGQKKTQQVLLTPYPDLLTVINVMKPDSAEQRNVINLLSKGIKQTITKQDGFVSASIHQSLDNSYVVNYAQWENQESLDATVALVNSGALPVLGKVFSSSNPDFHPYSVVSIYFGQ